MAMTLIERRLTSVSSRLLLVLSIAVLPLLLYASVFALMPSLPALRAAATLTAPLADQPALQKVHLLMADTALGAWLIPSRPSEADAAPPTRGTTPQWWMALLLAALGVLTAWGLGRRLLGVPAGPVVSATPPGSAGAALFSAAAITRREVTSDAPDAQVDVGLGLAGPQTAQFQQLADAMPQLVSIMQADCARSYVNQRWADFTGVPRSDILAHRWNRFLHPDDMPMVSSVWADAASRGESVEFEYRLRRADGCYRWMLGRAVPLAAAGEAQAAVAAHWLMTSTDIDDLKQAAVQLEKAVELKRLVGRVAKVGGWTIMLPDYRLTWSAENCLIHDAPVGYQPTLEEGIGCFLPEHRAVVSAYVDTCLADGTPYDFVLPKHTLKQRLIWVRCIGEPLRDEAGHIIGLQGAFQDVTEQKRAELRAKALEVQLATTMDGISDGFYVLDKNWAFSYLNASAERMFKRPRAELMGRTVWEMFPDKVGTAIENEFRLTTAEQKTRHFEAFDPPLATWFDVRLYPMGDGVAVYLQDVTQTRADQAQLRLLQSAVARLNDTVVIAQASAGPDQSMSAMPVVFVNEAFARCTGFEQADLMGQDFAAQLSTRLPAAEWARVSAAMAQWQPVHTELELISKAGAALWLEVDIAPIADASGSFTHWVAVKRDMTERRQYQQQIEQLNGQLEARVKRRTAQLQSANKELESFAYAVSHDLRSPLNTIAGFMPLLLRTEREQLSEQGRHYLSRISAGVDQMGQLIAGLLTLAHMSREQPRMESVDLTAIARRCESNCRGRQPERQAHINVQRGMLAEGDPRLLESVLDNLIGNAWKFSAREAMTVIDVGIHSGEGSETVFYVKDNGVGFDMAFEHKLFGTFERLHSPGQFVGTGIGLATVKRVINNHGGRIWAESRVGEGATFYFTLGAPDHVHRSNKALTG